MRCRIFILLFVCGLCSIVALQAQEHRMHPIVGTNKAAQQQFSSVEMRPISRMWLDEQLDPILQQRRKIRRIMEERAQQSIVIKPSATTQQNWGKTAIGRFALGNTSIDNWSPFPDRMLDARTLRFPMPKNMRPDKRPEHIRQADKLRK